MSPLVVAIVMCLGFSFGAFAQQQKVSIHVKDVDVSVVFRQIKDQTKLNFVYDPDQLASMSSVTMDVKNVSVDSCCRSYSRELLSNIVSRWDLF